MGMDSVFRVSLVLDMVDNMTSKVQGAADGVPSAVQKMNDAFGTMQKAGVAMTGMGTAIVGACMGTVTATFDTQDALAKVASLGVEDLGALEKAAKNFSDTWAGTTKSDFISASYDIKSGIASLTDEGVAQYTELAGLTAKATKATTADMTSLFATGYGIYKNYYSDLSDMEFGEMFSAGIATAVKNYKTSGTEMAGAIKMLGASATNANVPMEEQLAILGQLQATMSGTEAGTKYKSFLNTAASAGEKLGLNFLDANNQLLSMPDILEQLHGKYGDTIDAVEKKQLKDAFGTDEAIALIDLLYNNTDQLKTGIDDLQTSMDGGVETTKKMAEAISDTPAQKFQVLKQQMHNVTEELGQGLLPAVNTGLEAMIGLVQKGSDWVSNNQETVATIMRIVAILGVFLIVAGVVTTTIGTLGKAMTSLKTVTTLASKASGLFNSALLSSPITWVIGLIVALIAIFKACGGDVEQLGATFSNIFGKVGGFVGTAATAIAQKLPEFLQFGINLVLQIVSGIASGLPSLISGGVSMLESPDHGNSDDSTDFAKCRTFPASDITVRNFAGGSVNLAGWGDYHPVPVYRNHNVAAGDLIRRDTADSVTLDWNYTVSANYPVSWSSDPEYASTGDRDRAPGTFIGWDFADPDDPDGHHSEPAVCDFSRSSDPGDAGSGNCNRTPPAPGTGSSADPSGPSGDSLRAAVSDHIRYSDHFNDPVRTDLSHPDPDRHDPGIILRSCRCRDVDRLAGCRL